MRKQAGLKHGRGTSTSQGSKVLEAGREIIAILSASRPHLSTLPEVCGRWLCVAPEVNAPEALSQNLVLCRPQGLLMASSSQLFEAASTRQCRFSKSQAQFRLPSAHHTDSAVTVLSICFTRAPQGTACTAQVLKFLQGLFGLCGGTWDALKMLEPMETAATVPATKIQEQL